MVQEAPPAKQSTPGDGEEIPKAKPLMEAQADFWIDDLVVGDRVRYTPPQQNPTNPGCENGTVDSIGSYARVIFVRFDRTDKVEPTGIHTLRKIENGN